MEKSTPQWIAAARLLRPQGRRGELLADPLTDQPSLFSTGQRARIDDHETTIEDHWLPTGKNAGRLVLKLAGCNSINEAEKLAGQDLLLLAEAFPTLESDTWYVRDLLGCTLFDGDNPVGQITDVQYPMTSDGRTRLPDAAPLLSITQTPDAEPALVPFVRAWLDTVDLEHRRVTMHLPPGLLTVDASSDESASS